MLRQLFITAGISATGDEYRNYYRTELGDSHKSLKNSFQIYLLSGEKNQHQIRRVERPFKNKPDTFSDSYSDKERTRGCKTSRSLSLGCASNTAPQCGASPGKAFFIVNTSVFVNSNCSSVIRPF